MATQDVIEQLLALPDVKAQKRFLKEHVSLLDDQVADALKKQADRFLRADAQRSLEMANLLLFTGEVTGNPHHRALGLRAEGNVLCLGGRGEYQRACELYDEAAELYRTSGRLVEQAESQIGKLWALAIMGQYTEALETGEWVSRVLEKHSQWRRLAAVTLNLGLIHGRMDQDEKALALLDRAKNLYHQIGEEGKPLLPLADHNRAIVLRNLGRFEASIQASHRAWKTHAQLGHTADAARARHGLAITYFVLGRYNEALDHLDRVREVFLADGRARDAILVELFISDCLLQLRRFADVLETCQRVRGIFTAQGTRFEVAHTLLNEAMAYEGLGDSEAAMASLAEARRIFTEEGNDVWIACTELEMAALLLRRGQSEESLAAAEACASVFQSHSLPVREAHAHLIAARAAVALDRHDQALRLVGQTLHVARSRDIPSLLHKVHHLLGRLAAAEGDTQRALAEYDQAIQQVERLRGRLMLEFRVDFLEDKEVLYEDMVCLRLARGQPLQALEYAERAKSRTLLDLLAYRIDLSVQARDETDRPLVDQLMHLRAERDRLYRRWEGREESREEGWSADDESHQHTRQEMLALEKQITELWHRLLIRNADYARDASVWQVHTEAVQPHLPPETVLLEYYIAQQQLVAFLVTRNTAHAQRLTAKLAQLERLIQLLWLNLKAVPRSAASQTASLGANARNLLGRLHELLIAPLSDELGPHPRWVIVPHGPLHYLPFHALHDGQSYLLEKHEITSLPGASLLRYCKEARPAATDSLILGHSNGGRLPHTVQEGRAVAALLGGQAWVEEEATLTRVREVAPKCCAIHLAAHGEFRPDNPLFSGLALADGWLTTLDILNLRLKASLVVLSACQTGRSVVGGGDELLGLLRALLYAGAASVVLSLWTVEDRCTARLMETFYRKLVAGWAKGAALRYAQRQLMEGQNEGASATAETYEHPYFWAPFCLVGDAAPLHIASP